MIGKFCVVRCKDAAVHCGIVAGINGRTVLIHNARKLWQWKGANTVNEVALHGVDEEFTRLSEPVDAILVLDACEVIPCTEKAQANLSRSRWGQ